MVSVSGVSGVSGVNVFDLAAKWHECHFAQQNSRRVRMIFAEEILICAAEENIYRV